MSEEPAEMFSCDCCGRHVVPRKLPGIGYYCDPCHAEESWREYPWSLDDDGWEMYLRDYHAHAAVCAAVCERGPMSRM